MSASFNTLRSGHNRIAIPTVRVAFALSLVLHAALLLPGWRPILTALPFEDSRPGRPGGSLAVRLAPAPDTAAAMPPAPAVRPQPVPAHKPPPSTAARRASAPPSPRVLARASPPPSSAVPPRAETAPAPAGDDLASYVEARRRAREPAAAAPPSQAGPAAAPAETEQQRHNRIAAANLGLDRAPGFGADRKSGGGIFQIQRLGYDSAEFVFYGWNKHIKRNAQQTIEVRRGDNPSIELAVVRRMIAIVREQESGDFVWESRRLGRDVWLSARAADNAGLEEFVMREFFSGGRLRN